MNCPCQLCQQRRIADYQLWLHIRGYARPEFCAPKGIERNRHNPAQHAPIECRNPFGAILRPKQYTVADADAAIFKKSRKPPGQVREFTVGHFAPAHALVADDRDFAFVFPEVVQQCGQVLAHYQLLFES